MERMKGTMDYGAVVDRGPWPEAIAREFERARDNGCVGTRLISETERVRVWEYALGPGERIGFHRHVLDYFWTAVSRARALAHAATARPSRRATSPARRSMRATARASPRIHDLENTGDAELVFVTVEFLDSANAALPVPGEVRAKAA